MKRYIDWLFKHRIKLHFETEEQYSFRTVLAVLLSLLLVSAARSTDRKLALVIGNAQYQHIDTLANPMNDANGMSEALEKMGFDVMSYTNLSSSALKSAIREFGEKMHEYDIVLFYYAGHGIEVLGKNYIVPIDASAKTISEVKKSCISTNAIIYFMKATKNHTNIIILDACRKNPFSTTVSSKLNDGLALMDAPKGTIVSFATSPGYAASDGAGTNGLFTKALIQHIPQYDIEIKEMFEKVREYVIEKSNHRQVPWESTSLTEPLILRKSPEAELQVSIVEGDSVIFEKEGTLHAQSNLKNVSYVWYRNGHQITNTFKADVNRSGKYQVKGISHEGQILISDLIYVSIKSFVDLQIFIEEGDDVKFDKTGVLHAKSNVRGKFTWLRNQKKIGEGPLLTIEASGFYNLVIETEDGRKAVTQSSKVALKK